jgi:hypothetical protein
VRGCALVWVWWWVCTGSPHPTAGCVYTLYTVPCQLITTEMLEPPPRAPGGMLLLSQDPCSRRASGLDPRLLAQDPSVSAGFTVQHARPWDGGTGWLAWLRRRPIQPTASAAPAPTVPHPLHLSEAPVPPWAVAALARDGHVRLQALLTPSEAADLVRPAIVDAMHNQVRGVCCCVGVLVCRCIGDSGGCVALWSVEGWRVSHWVRRRVVHKKTIGLVHWGARHPRFGTTA